MATLKIQDLHVEIEGKEILKVLTWKFQLAKSTLSWDRTEQVNLRCPQLLWGIQNMK